MTNSQQLKDKRYKFQVINIKLQTPKYGSEKLQAYSDLILKLKNRKLHSSVAENTHMIIYSCYPKTSLLSQTKYHYGDLGKGIYFEEEIINSINIEESKDEKRQSDKNTILQPKTAEYIFIPEIHRLVYINEDGITINNIHKFLTDSLKKVADKGDIVEIEIIKDPKITDEILSAFAIHSVNYVISYTNDDFNQSAERRLDERLKKLNAGKFEVKIESDHNGYLNTSEPDELIEGGVKLAEQNGLVKEAVITQNEGDRRTILSNMERPRFFDVTANDEDYRELIVEKMLNLFPRKI